MLPENPPKNYKTFFMKMANPSSRQQKSGRENIETELKNVPQIPSNGATSTQLPDVSCRPEHCRDARHRYQPPDLTGSPWHKKKTFFFISLLVLFIIWVVVYSTLSHLDIL